MDLHGGNIYQSNIELDFSVNVNPLGPPEGIRDIFLNPGDWLSHYPRRDQKENEDRLLALIGLCEKGTIPGRSTPSPGTEIGAVIGNGASELLMARFLALRPKRVLLTEPSFYGYRHAARAVGAELLSYPLREDLDFALDEGLIKQIDPSIDLILLASPNNPNGGRIRDDLLREILRKAASHRIPLLLDACFMPLSLLGEEGQAPGIRPGERPGGKDFLRSIPMQPGSRASLTCTGDLRFWVPSPRHSPSPLCALVTCWEGKRGLRGYGSCCRSGISPCRPRRLWRRSPEWERPAALGPISRRPDTSSDRRAGI